MRGADILSGLFWLAIAIGVAISGWDLGLGTLGDPGSGFMIFWVGAAMTVLCLAALIVALRNKSAVRFADLWNGLRWQTVPYVAVLLALYAWLLPTLGFPVVTILLLLVLFKTIEPQGWTMAIGGAVVTTAITWLVFARWLGTQLPLGAVWVG